MFSTLPVDSNVSLIIRKAHELLTFCFRWKFYRSWWSGYGCSWECIGFLKRKISGSARGYHCYEPETDAITPQGSSRSSSTENFFNLVIVLTLDSVHIVFSSESFSSTLQLFPQLKLFWTSTEQISSLAIKHSVVGLCPPFMIVPLD